MLALDPCEEVLDALTSQLQLEKNGARAYCQARRVLGGLGDLYSSSVLQN